MPSPRPVRPRPSVVVALTLTRPTSIAHARARFARIRSRCGDTRGLRHDGRADVEDRPASFRHHGHHLCEQHGAVGTGEGGVAVGEVVAEVPERGRTEHSVGDGVEHAVGVGVAGEAGGVLDRDAGEHHGTRPSERARRRRSRCARRASPVGSSADRPRHLIKVSTCSQCEHSYVPDSVPRRSPPPGRDRSSLRWR